MEKRQVINGEDGKIYFISNCNYSGFVFNGFAKEANLYKPRMTDNMRIGQDEITVNHTARTANLFCFSRSPGIAVIQ